jgi:hypothetical protein
LDCPRCKNAICYLCRKDVTAEGYEHFWSSPKPCPPDRCPLWTNDDVVQRIEMEKL